MSDCSHCGHCCSCSARYCSSVCRFVCLPVCLNLMPLFRPPLTILTTLSPLSSYHHQYHFSPSSSSPPSPSSSSPPPPSPRPLFVSQELVSERETITKLRTLVQMKNTKVDQLKKKLVELSNIFKARQVTFLSNYVAFMTFM